MVLELLFEYGEHESSSVAQILNVVRNSFRQGNCVRRVLFKLYCMIQFGLMNLLSWNQRRKTLNVCIEWFLFQGRFHEALFKKRQKSNQTLIQEHRKCDLHIWFFTLR